jgi:methylated-DNA-protein-cysteine methyltransferase-like protein
LPSIVRCLRFAAPPPTPARLCCSLAIEASSRLPSLLSRSTLLLPRLNNESTKTFFSSRRTRSARCPPRAREVDRRRAVRLRRDSKRRDLVACERKVIFELDGTSRKVSRESPSHDGVAASRFDGIRLDRVDEALFGLALPRAHFLDSTVSPTFVLDHGIRGKAPDGAVEVSRVACLDEACDRRGELDHFLIIDSMASQQQSRRERIVERIRSIPEGFVRTYGDIDPGAPRLVGRILSTTHGLPWHRVVRADGSIPKGAKQRELLAREGVPMRNDRVDLSAARVPPEF